MRVQNLRGDPNSDKEALKYPDFLLQDGQGTVPGTKDRHGRINLPKSKKLVNEFQQLINNSFDEVGNNYTDSIGFRHELS